MRVIKPLLLGIFLLFIVLTGLSLLFPSHIRIARAINVSAPRDKAQAVLSDLHTWDRWNGFIKGTPLTGRSLSAPSSGKGAVLRSDQLIITELSSTPEMVDFDWDQVGGRRFESGFNLLQVSPDSLAIQYWMDFHFRWYPWDKLGIFVYDRQWGPLLAESLDSLNRYLENSP
jgi:hypothetical protein